MKKYIIQSINLMNDHIILVCLISIIEMPPLIFKFPALMIVQVVLRFIVLIYIYGLLIDIILSRKNDFKQIISSNAVNYIIVRIMISVPVIILMILSSPFSLTVKSIIRYLASFLIYLLTVYVIPLIFIKRLNIQVIKPGVQYFMSNLSFNRPFIILIGLELVVTIVASTLITNYNSGTILARFALQFIINYINFMVFGLAALVLVQESELVQETEILN